MDTISVLFRLFLLFVLITGPIGCGKPGGANSDKSAGDKPAGNQDGPTGQNGDPSNPNARPNPTQPPIITPHNDRLFHQTKTRAELKAQIEQEFKEGVYIRQIRRYDDEIKYVIEKRIDIREGKAQPDEVVPYWVSTSVVRENLKIPLYDDTTKTGLVISNSAELGYFSPYDAAAPTKVKKAGVDIKPPVSILTQDMFLPGDIAYANHLYTFADVKKRLADMIINTAMIPKVQTIYGDATGQPGYNEAIIFYKVTDILGVWAHSADDSFAIAFQKKIKDDYGADLPIVKYDFKIINAAKIRYDNANYQVNFSVN